MTTTTSAPAAARPGHARLWSWIAMAVLVVGVVVAVFGIRAGVAAFQRDQAIRDYADARSAAAYFVKNGDTVSALMKRMQILDAQDVRLMKAQRAALVADHTTEFNSLTSSANNRTERQQSLHNQMHRFQTAFEKALNH